MKGLRRFLLSIEIGAAALAALFGIMWLRNPAGPYEPMTFLALLFGGTIVELVRRLLPEGPGEAPRPRKSDAPGTAEQQNSRESSRIPAVGDARPSPLRVQEGSLNLGVLVNREVRVVYPEPFSVRPNLEVRVESSFGNKVSVESEDASGFTVVKPSFWVSGAAIDILRWRATGRY
jgi:hypothetical protein